MTLYEAVYTRKSIRNFRKDKVETSILEGMIQFYHEMEPLFPGIETSIELIDTQGSKKAKSRLGGIINVVAPYYLVIYTEDKERADMNAGYIMQQISLYLFSKGVGSCFQGMGHLKGEMPKEGMRCVILMAIGYPKVDMMRNQEDAKRESMEDLCAVKEPPRRFVKEFLEVARLAPSAFNSQPWRFVVYENRVHVFSKQTVAHRRLLGKYNEFDFGIMLANIMIAAEQLWVDVDLIRLDNNHTYGSSEQPLCDQYHHAGTVKLKLLEFSVEKSDILEYNKVSEKSTWDVRHSCYFEPAML